MISGLPLVQGGGPGGGGSWLQGSVLPSEAGCVKDKRLATKGNGPGKFKLSREFGKELPKACFLVPAPLRSAEVWTGASSHTLPAGQVQ